jgi:membrane protein DedA with SNARE-associated domain
VVDSLLAWVTSLPSELVYLVLGAGAAVENVVPAVPADTFVLLGGFLAALRPSLDPKWVFLSTWLFNVASAMAMYRVGHTHGRSFFESGWGRHLLNPRQMERMRLFYRTWGSVAIFFTRFLPGLRAVVPVFAGVSHQRFLSVLLPLTLASGIWYGGLVWAGMVAGRNLDRVRALFGNVNTVLLVVALVVGAAAFAWWWRTRHHDE